MRHLVPLVALAALTACAGAPPRYYKGNLHTHTLWSDGNHFPEMVVDWYAQRDYDFLALTDHNVLADHEKWMQNDQVVRRGGRAALSEYRARFGADWVEERQREGKLEVRLKRLDEIAPLFADLLLIPAEEVTSSFESRPIHINASNVASRLAPQRGESVQDVIRKTMRAVMEHAAANDRRVLAHLNHPNFGWGINADDLARVTEEHFFEVYNGHPGVNHRGDADRPGTERLWDIANTTRRRELDAPLLMGLGTDDCHNYHNASGSTPGRGWVMVRAAACTASSLLAAMERGDFYASSGVTLDDVRFDGQTLSVDIAPAAGASYVTTFIGTRADGEPGEVLARVEGLHPRYRARGDELFVRATVTSSATADNPVWDGQPKQAWVQPVVPARAPR
ncbi:MAG: hypothetical protein VYA51_06485 [Planctomycetota bacterium]|nr:hypothetical protein [Planctomycetota bacterium]